MPRTVGDTRTIPVDSAVWVDLVIRNKTHPDTRMNNTDPTIVQSHQQFMPCVFCKSRHVALLDGMVTCQECYSVVDRIIDYGAEWRFSAPVYGGGVIGSGAQSSTPTTTLAMGGRAKQRVVHGYPTVPFLELDDVQGADAVFGIRAAGSNRFEERHP
eukprot:gene29382-5735_t